MKRELPDLCNIPISSGIKPRLCISQFSKYWVPLVKPILTHEKSQDPWGSRQINCVCYVFFDGLICIVVTVTIVKDKTEKLYTFIHIPYVGCKPMVNIKLNTFN